jgi:hypothetical protein
MRGASQSFVAAVITGAFLPAEYGKNEYRPVRVNFSPAAGLAEE